MEPPQSIVDEMMKSDVILTILSLDKGQIFAHTTARNKATDEHGARVGLASTLAVYGATIEDVVKVARGQEKVALHPEALERIKRCRAFLEKKVEAREIMYGVNTGIGEFSEIVLDDQQTKDFQRYLIYNHAAGIGEPVPIPHVRAAMLARINVHAHGNSGCRPEITQTYVEMLNQGVTPVVCEKGSVGACGDLAPMSQIALTLMGEGEVYYQGQRIPTRQAFENAGIKAPGLHIRDGLAAINGSNLTCAIGCLEIYDVERWILQAEIAAAMTLEALMAKSFLTEEDELEVKELKKRKLALKDRMYLIMAEFRKSKPTTS